MKAGAMAEIAIQESPWYPWERAGRAGSWAWNASTHEFFLWSRSRSLPHVPPRGQEPRPGTPGGGAGLPKVHPEDLQRYLERIERAVRSRIGWDFEYRCVLPDGTARDIQSIAHPLFDADSGLAEYLGMEVDVTERKRTEEALRESEARFRAFVDHAADAFFLHDNDDQGRILDVNRHACESLGYSREELVNQSAMMFDHWLTPAQLMRIGERVAAGEAFAFETRHTRKDGTDFPVEIRIRQFFHGGRHLGVSLARDITERKQAERNLSESHDLLRALVEGSPDPIFAKDLQGRYLMINSAGARLLGKSVEDVIGKDDASLLPPEAARAIRELDLRILVTGETESLEETVSGPGPRIFHSTKAPFRDRQGNVIGLVGISRDVSEMKRLEADLRQAQKMEAIGRLAGGVAHDFNNLLGVIIGYSELVFNRLATEDFNRGLLFEVQKAADRAAGLTRQLLAFSRKQVLQPRVLNLNPLVADLGAMLQRLIGEKIEVSRSLDRDLGMVQVDPGQFEQAVINLALNARDAMGGTGVLVIATRNARLDEGDMGRRPDARPGEYVVLTVSDDGHGMDEATKARIFEPFFTTKEAGKGTGLGLAMVYGFVKQSGGHVEVESEPGRGTTFRMFLPRTGLAATAPDPVPVDYRVSGGAETILLVEDEEVLRTMLRQVLQSHGYSVLEARDGQDGLWMAGQHQGPIHVLVTDLVMPRMGGRELADTLARQRPDLRILFTSGHTEDPVLQRGETPIGAAFVQKPFSPLALARKVRQLLDKDAPIR
jgi:two-component system, cell cycle sensor histidine kinase and response regulator CckA